MQKQIPQEFGDFGVLLHAGFKPKKALLLNLGSGLAAVIGAVLVLILGKEIALEVPMMSLAAGGFLYIACADLVPELRTSVCRAPRGAAGAAHPGAAHLEP